MRRVPLWLTGLTVVLAAAACGAGGDHPALAVSPTGQAGRGSAGWAFGAGPGWRIVQALPAEPGTGKPGGGYTDMLSVAATGAHEAWAVGDICPPQCNPRTARVLVEHWAGAGWRPIPAPPGTGPLIPPTVISASSATNAWLFADTAASTARASRWNGRRWTSFRFPRELRITAAAVFSRTDVWAFGELFGGEIHARTTCPTWCGSTAAGGSGYPRRWCRRTPVHRRPMTSGPSVP